MESQELKSQLTKIIHKSDNKLLRLLLAVASEYQKEVDVTASHDYTKVQSSDLPSQKDGADENTLYRLVYTSARAKNCDDEALEDILLAARRNNSKLDITGMMVHTKDRFLQILEGPYKNVLQLYNTIKIDPRHGGSMVRYFEPVKSRQFGDWNMAFKDLNSDEMKYNTNVSNENRMQYESLMDGDLSSYTDEGMRVLKTFLLFS